MQIKSTVTWTINILPCPRHHHAVYLKLLYITFLLDDCLPEEEAATRSLGGLFPRRESGVLL